MDSVNKENIPYNYLKNNSNKIINKSKNQEIGCLKKEDVNKKIEDCVYIPLKVLKEYNLENKYKSIKQATQESMARETSPFAKTKPSSVEHIVAPPSIDKVRLFPKKSLTRLLTGDVKPEWITGLGRMESDKVTPAQGYKDVFVSNLEEYERKGIKFDPRKKNDPVDMAEKLDLKGGDLDKIKNQGAWLIEIHPSSKLAVPTERKSEWNPEYIEGGYTKSEQREWVTPNVGLDEEARAGRVKIFKIDNKGQTVEWKFFQGKLLPNYPINKNGVPVEGSWRHAIDQHIKEQGKKII